MSHLEMDHLRDKKSFNNNGILSFIFWKTFIQTFYLRGQYTSLFIKKMIYVGVKEKSISISVFENTFTHNAITSQDFLNFLSYPAQLFTKFEILNGFCYTFRFFFSFLCLKMQRSFLVFEIEI